MRRKTLRRYAVLLAVILASTQIFGATSFAAPASASPGDATQALHEEGYQLPKDAADSIVAQLFGGGATGAAKLTAGPDGSAYEYEFSGDFASGIVEEMTDLAGQGANANDLPNEYVDNSKEAIDEIIAQLNAKTRLRRADPGSDITAEVVFIIDATGSMGPYIDAVKRNVADFASHLADQNINLRLGLIEYQDIMADGMDSTIVYAPGYTTWMDATGFLGELSKMYAKGGGDEPETPWDAFGYLFNGTMLWSDDAYKFAMLITDASYWDNNRHGLTGIDDVISKLSAAEIQTSVVTNTYNTMYGNLAGYTGGIIANIASSFSTVLSQYADSILSGTLPTLNYPVRVVDNMTNLPIGNASISHASGRATTDANGIAILSGKSNTFTGLSVSKLGYDTFTQASLSLDMGSELYTFRLTPLVDGPGDSPYLTKDMFVNPPEDSATLYGPTLNVLGRDFNLFSIPAEFSFNAFDPSKLVIKHDSDKKKFDILIGASASRISPSDADWGGIYTSYKNAVAAFSKRPVGTLINDLRKIRGSVKSYSNLIFPVDGYIGGYAEASYAEGELDFLGGSVIVCANGTTKSWTSPFPPASYVLVKVDFKYDIKGQLAVVRVNDTGKIGFFQSDSIELAANVSDTFSLGIPKVAAVGGGINEGLLDAKIAFPFKSFAESVSAKFSGDFLFQLKLLFFESRESFTFDEADLYLSGPSAARIGEVTASDFELIPSSSAAPMARSARLISTTLPEDSIFFMPDVYPNSTPQIVQLDSSGKTLMVWVDNDVSRAPYNRPALYYSIYDDGVWSTAAQVDNNGTADAGPALVAYGGSAYLVWQDAKRAFRDDEEIALETALAAMDIKYAKFDGASNTFSGIVSLAASSANTKYEASPIISANGKEITVAWIENSVNDPLLIDGQNTLVTKKFTSRWNPERVLATGLPLLTNFAINSEGYIAYTTGQFVGGSIIHNGILYTRTPTGSSRSYTGVTAAESKTRSMTSLQAVGDEFFWGFESGMKSLKLPGGSPVRENNLDFPQFTVASSFDGSSKAILTTTTNGMLNELQASYKDDGGAWSEAVQISDYGMYLSNISSFINPDGDICAAFNCADILDSGATGLMVAVFGQTSALEVDEYAYYSDYDMIPGGTMDFSVFVRNSGTRSITGLKAAIYRDGAFVDMVETLYTIPEDTYEKVPITSIASGEELYLEIPYDIPNPLSPHNVSIEILAAGEEPGIPGRTASAYLDSNFADLEITSATIARLPYDPGSVARPGGIITAAIRNNGYASATDARVLLFDAAGIRNGVPITYIDLDDIAPGSEVYVEFPLSPELIDATSSVDHKFFRVYATTSRDEWNVANNEYDLLLAPLLPDNIQLETDSIALEAGATARVSYRLTPPHAYGGVFWLSSNSNVATVEFDTGLISAKREGEAIITVTTADGSKSASLLVQVSDTTSVRGVSIVEGDLSLAIGETASLTAVVQPETAANKNVSWHSSNTDVATVEDGVVTAINAGEADIIVVTASGGYSDSIHVSVSEEASMGTYARITPARVSVKVNATYALTFSTDGPSYRFTSSNARVAEVAPDGTVRALRAGNAVITLELTDGSGLKASTLVTVSY